jgi:hypothetical protein
MEREEDVVAGRKVMPPRPPGELVLRNTCKQHKNINKTNILQNFTRSSSDADADPGSGAFLTPRSGVSKKIRIRIRDEQPGSYFRELKNNFLG